MGIINGHSVIVRFYNSIVSDPIHLTKFRWKSVWTATSFAHLFLFFKHIFVSSHMYLENLEGNQVIVGSMNMGYDIYPTLPGIELTTCSVPNARRFTRPQ